jgi:hypothetical protein
MYFSLAEPLFLGDCNFFNEVKRVLCCRALSVGEGKLKRLRTVAMILDAMQLSFRIFHTLRSCSKIEQGIIPIILIHPIDEINGSSSLPSRKQAFPAHVSY